MFVADNRHSCRQPRVDPSTVRNCLALNRTELVSRRPLFTQFSLLPIDAGTASLQLKQPRDDLGSQLAYQ